MKKDKKSCKTCKKEWRCILGCPEMNAILAKIDKELEKKGI